MSRPTRSDEEITQPIPEIPNQEPDVTSEEEDSSDGVDEIAPLVLVVAHDRSAADAATQAFRALGYRTCVELGGPDAVFAIETEAPDILLLDSSGADMDAVKFLEVVRRMNPGLGASVIVAVPEDDDGARPALRKLAGVEEVLRSPVTAGSVAGAVGRVRLLELAPGEVVTEPDVLERPALRSPVVAVPPEALPEGTIIDRRYEVLGLFGKGGAAHVYRVRDRMRGEVVALKLLNTKVHDPHAEARFDRELRILSAIRNPSVVRTFDAGRLDGRPYFTMEALDGRTLRQFLQEQSAKETPIHFGMELLLHVCRGLVATHRRGVIHRDVKPSNLFIIGSGPRVKLTDFGVARDDHPSSIMTTVGIVVGTPGYVAPERLMVGGPQAPASDIFSLGVVAYEIYARRRPFEGRNPVDLLRAMSEEPPKPLTDEDARIPASLDDLIRAMIAYDPIHRPASVVEVAQELRVVRSALMNG